MQRKKPTGRAPTRLGQSLSPGGRPPPRFVTCYGSEFIAKALGLWLERLGVQTLYIEPGSPWENGYCESFNSKLRDEFLNIELLSTLNEAHESHPLARSGDGPAARHSPRPSPGR